MAFSSKLLNLILRNFLITALCTPVSAVFATTPYFNGADFGACLAVTDRDQGSPQANTGLTEVANRRAEYFRIKSQRVNDYQPPIRDIYYYFFRNFSSLILVNPSHNGAAAIPDDAVNLKRIFGLEQQRITPTSAMLADPDVISHLPRFFPQDLDGNETIRQTYSATYRLANHMISFLIDKPEKSVTHIELVQEMTRLMDGDLLSALGVIGFVFSNEADNISPRRFGHLSTRMKPLFTDDEIDSVGYNYHFWGYLNLSIQGFDTIADLESRRQEANDPGDRMADILGIQAGQIYRQQRGSLRAHCRLN